MRQTVSKVLLQMGTGRTSKLLPGDALILSVGLELDQVVVYVLVKLRAGAYDQVEHEFEMVETDEAFEWPDELAHARFPLQYPAYSGLAAMSSGVPSNGTGYLGTVFVRQRAVHVIYRGQKAE